MAKRAAEIATRYGGGGAARGGGGEGGDRQTGDEAEYGRPYEDGRGVREKQEQNSSLSSSWIRPPASSSLRPLLLLFLYKSSSRKRHGT